jgi:hypothetical protein
MAIQPYYDGAALVRIDAGAGAGLESLGYTEDGIQISKERFRLPVFGDQNGGTDGPPIDVQHLGGIWRVNATFTSWEASVADKLEQGIAGGTAGSEGTVGTLLFTEANKSFRLLIHTPIRPLNFLRAVVEDFEINKGTKHSKLTISWACYKNASNVFFNSTTS